MKFYAAVLLLALATIALAEKPANVESIEPVAAEGEKNAVQRDKRGYFLGAYTAPVAYSAYTAPVAYTSYPYAYSAGYRAYPYYAPYYSSYVL